MNGASRIRGIEGLIGILCHYFWKGGCCDKPTWGKTESTRVTCLDGVRDSRRSAGYLTRCGDSHGANDQWNADIMRSVRPSQLAASVSVQGRSRASKADREGSSLPRIQRQRGWLNVSCYACQIADGTRISGRRASDVCDFASYRFGASQIPDC